VNITPWLAGAMSAAAVMTGFAATPVALAATHPTAHTPVIMPFFAGKTPLTRKPGTTYTGFWGGYAAVADKGVKLRYAAASFNVPSLNCASDTSGAASQVAAMDGITGPAEMTGIIEDCNADGTFSITGFYQLGDTDGFSTGTINAGDAIQASVYDNDSTGKYSFTVTDVTTGQTIVNATAACPSGFACEDASSEAITTMSANSEGPAPLADYGMENFTGGAVTSRNGTKGNFGKSKLWNPAEFALNDGDGNAAATSALAGGSAFATTWRSGS